MEAKHKALGDSVSFKETKDFLGNPMIKITFKDRSTTTMTPKQFHDIFEVINA